MPDPIFISFASEDRRFAERIATELQERGFGAWISTKGVRPGENYQEAIVNAIEGARLMLIVFSGYSNNSDEVKKELSLASRAKLPVIPLRIEDVQPNAALLYEFSTRQWVDFIENWDAAIAALSAQVEIMLDADERQKAGGIRVNDRRAANRSEAPRALPTAKLRLDRLDAMRGYAKEQITVILRDGRRQVLKLPEEAFVWPLEPPVGLQLGDSETPFDVRDVKNRKTVWLNGLPIELSVTSSEKFGHELVMALIEGGGATESRFQFDRIPPRIAEAARRVNQMPDDERILAIFKLSTLGLSDDIVVFGSNKLYLYVRQRRYSIDYLLLAGNLVDTAGYRSITIGDTTITGVPSAKSLVALLEAAQEFFAADGPGDPVRLSYS